jgi:hypothetical protein
MFAKGDSHRQSFRVSAHARQLTNLTSSLAKAINREDVPSPRTTKRPYMECESLLLNFKASPESGVDMKSKTTSKVFVHQSLHALAVVLHIVNIIYFIVASHDP